jgi:hypothetical protein
MTFAPRIEGVVPIRSSAEQFAAAFRERVTGGLVFGRPHARSKYQIVEDGGGILRVVAADFSSALNVGLNDVQLRIRSGSVEFRVEYWRWASYAVGLAGALGIIGLILLLTFDVRGYIAEYATFGLSGLSTDQHFAIAWVMVLFWGFVWPWLLVALHKIPLRRLVQRIVHDVDAKAVGR